MLSNSNMSGPVWACFDLKSLLNLILNLTILVLLRLYQTFALSDFQKAK